PFDLVAYTDSDYAGESLDRKSTTGGCQFLGSRLISWLLQVAVDKCFGFRINYLIMGKAKKSVKLRMEKLLRMELELMLFWSTVMVKTINGEVQLHALVDGKKIIITESSVRRDLQLANEEGVDCLPNSTIFEQLTLMGHNNLGSLKDEAVHKELGDSLVRDATIGSSLEAEQDSGNINKTQSKGTPNESSSLGTTSGGGPRGNTLQSDEDRLKLDELMALCPTLQNRLLDWEKTKTTQHNEIASLKKRVKKLEKKNRSRTHKLKRLYKVGLTARVESSDNEESLGEDASKQGRIDAIDEDEEITLISVQNVDEDMFDVNVLDGEEVFVAEQEVASNKESNVVSTASDAIIVSAATITTATIKTIDDITLAQALM
ncbi:hypothetical protein Tco_1431128, partial [Tanacetum coccineum]